MILRPLNQSLRKAGLREEIKVLASGKIISSIDILRVLDAGADGIYMARGFMFALGCVQSLKCNRNTCPVGLTTMDKSRRKALVPEDKGNRVYNFHHNTLKGVNEMLAACGLSQVGDFTSSHLGTVGEEGRSV